MAACVVPASWLTGVIPTKRWHDEAGGNRLTICVAMIGMA